VSESAAKDITIQPGDLYWAQRPDGEIAHPQVVIQIDDATVVVCALTSNLERISWPGNVLLDVGEGGLSRSSVVEVAKQTTVTPTALGTCIGRLSPERVEQILAGLRFVARAYWSKGDQRP
jgi:mRNA interferase MazF